VPGLSWAGNHVFEFDPDLIVPDESLSLENGAIEAWRKNGKRMNIFYSRVLADFCRDFGIDYTAPFAEIPKKVRDVLMYGTDAKGDNGTGTSFEGVIPNLQRRFENTESEWVNIACTNTCPSSRAKPAAERG
jgi:excinuclease ABC subunit A